MHQIFVISRCDFGRSYFERTIRYFSSVEYEEAYAFAEENSLLFMETSAKTAVSDAFRTFTLLAFGPGL